jgi:hypothetical protein
VTDRRGASNNTTDQSITVSARSWRRPGRRGSVPAARKSRRTAPAAGCARNSLATTRALKLFHSSCRSARDPHQVQRPHRRPVRMSTSWSISRSVEESIARQPGAAEQGFAGVHAVISTSNHAAPHPVGAGSPIAWSMVFAGAG